MQSAALYAKAGLYAYDTVTNTTTFELDLEYITETVACNNQLFIVAGDLYERTLYKWVSSNVSEVIFTNAYALCGVTCIVSSDTCLNFIFSNFLCILFVF